MRVLQVGSNSDLRVGCSTAVAAFLDPEKYRNAVIPVYDEVLTCGRVVEIFTEVTGIKARRELCCAHGPQMVHARALTQRCCSSPTSIAAHSRLWARCSDRHVAGLHAKVIAPSCLSAYGLGTATAGSGSRRWLIWRPCYRRRLPPCCGTRTHTQTSMGESPSNRQTRSKPLLPHHFREHSVAGTQRC